MDKFYITTAIAYTNAPPHIGFALELVQADVIARWHGLRGEERFFLTGTDEHGRKVAKAADEAGEEPRPFVDRLATRFQELTKVLNISNDDFIRTSDQKRHWPGVLKMWQALESAGDIYKGQYKGLYCEGCEAFLKKSDLVYDAAPEGGEPRPGAAGRGKCPNHDREPEVVEEENWFFRLSKYGDELTRIIDADEFRIVPETRKNEVLSFIAQGLEDLSISRPSRDLSWGVPVPGDDTQTMYVWVDALSNYVTALGFGQKVEPGTLNLFEKFWPADVHVIGKDILRFHAVIWPAMLLSAKLPLPKSLLVHGFIHAGTRKMSKSLGNVIDPFDMVERYSADALRYFLLHEIPTVKDGDFTDQRFQEVYAADLAHTLGNLLSRVTKLGDGQEITPQAEGDVQKVVRQAWKDYESALEAFNLHKALDQAIGVARFANEFIERTKPWEGDKNLDGALPQLSWMLGNLAWMLTPFLPETAKKIFDQLGIDPGAEESWEGKPLTMQKGEALFPQLQ